MLDSQSAVGADRRARLWAQVTTVVHHWHNWSEYEHEVLTIYPKKLLQIKTKPTNKQSKHLSTSFLLAWKTTELPPVLWNTKHTYSLKISFALTRSHQ